MKFLSFFLLSLLFTMTNTVLADETSAMLPRPTEVDVDFTVNDLEKSWIKEFRYVIVINKADSGKEAQSIKVYEYGQLIRESRVSTGRDKFEPKGENHSKRDSWSVTPTGYFTPTFLDKDHRSSAYGGIFSGIFGGTKMPYSIFFNGDIALHEAPKGTDSMLGKKASGGCIRLSPSIAGELFERVKETSGFKIPDFKVDGTIVSDENGNYNYRSKKGHSALIIVKNRIVQ